MKKREFDTIKKTITLKYICLSLLKTCSDPTAAETMGVSLFKETHEAQRDHCSYLMKKCMKLLDAVGTDMDIQ